METVQSSIERNVNAGSFWRLFLVLLILTPFALLAGFASAGAGHGNYLLAKIVFPYTMLSTLVFDVITAPFLVLAFVQFPIYGAVLGLSNQRGVLRYALLSLSIVHLGAVVMCLFSIGENFS